VGTAGEVGYTFREVVPGSVEYWGDTPGPYHTPNLPVPIKGTIPVSIEYDVVPTQEPRRALVLEPKWQRIV
jgi:hypothetical protein